MSIRPIPLCIIYLCSYILLFRWLFSLLLYNSTRMQNLIYNLYTQVVYCLALSIWLSIYDCDGYQDLKRTIFPLINKRENEAP